MNLKLKAALSASKVSRWNRKARKIGKKYTKFPEDEKFTIEYRHNFVYKKFKKMMKILNVELEVIGYENLPKAPAVLAPNHSSSMDPGLILMALMNPDPSPEAVDGIPLFLAKKEILENKKAKGYAQILDTFYIDRKNPRQAIVELDNMSEFSKKHKRYEVIFPEGTRSRNGNILEFKGGAFRSAKRSFVPIVPVTINNALAITNLERTGKLKVQVIFHKPLKPMSFITQDTKSIATNVQKIVQSAWVKPTGKRSTKEDQA